MDNTRTFPLYNKDDDGFVLTGQGWDGEGKPVILEVDKWEECEEDDFFSEEAIDAGIWLYLKRVVKTGADPLDQIQSVPKAHPVTWQAKMREWSIDIESEEATVEQTVEEIEETGEVPENRASKKYGLVIDLVRRGKSGPWRKPGHPAVPVQIIDFLEAQPVRQMNDEDEQVGLIWFQPHFKNFADLREQGHEIQIKKDAKRTDSVVVTFKVNEPLQPNGRKVLLKSAAKKILVNIEAGF